MFSKLLKSLKNNQQQENDLEKWQKELVEKGEYDVCNFEEEELEDDDYHFEDEQ